MELKTKISGILAVFAIGLVIGIGFWAWKSESPEPRKFKQFDIFNLEGLLEKSFEGKDFKHISEVLEKIGPQIKQSGSRIDQYIFEYYSAKLMLDSLPESKGISNPDQFIYMTTSMNKRLEEASRLFAKEKSDLDYQAYWIKRFTDLRSQLDQKGQELYNFKRSLVSGSSQ